MCHMKKKEKLKYYNCIIDNNTKYDSYICNKNENDCKNNSCYELKNFKEFVKYDVNESESKNKNFYLCESNFNKSENIYIIDAGNYNNPLNNKYSCKITININSIDYTFNSAELAYQGLKFTGTNYSNEIKEISKLKYYDKQKIDEIFKNKKIFEKLDTLTLMRYVLETKFQIKEFFNLLKNTENTYIIYHSTREIDKPDLWTDAPYGFGYNVIGMLLMELRDETINSDFLNNTGIIDSLKLYYNNELKKYKNENNKKKLFGSDLIFFDNNIIKNIIDKSIKKLQINDLSIPPTKTKVKAKVKTEDKLPVGCKLAEYESKNIIAFYGALGNVLLGNFYMSDIKFKVLEKEYIFKCAEAVYQAHKILFILGLTDQQKEQEIVQFTNFNGDQSFQFAKQLKFDKEFHNKKIKIMLNILVEKFVGNEFYKKLLVNTGKKLLIEHRPKKIANDEWTDNFDGKNGLNYLGKLLMLVRDCVIGEKKLLDDCVGDKNIMSNTTFEKYLEENPNYKEEYDNNIKNKILF